MPDQTPLPVLLRDLQRRWRLATGITLAVVAGATAYAESLPNSYAASAVVSFSPKPNTNAGADTVRVVLPKYVAYATARPTVNRVARRIGEAPSELAAAVDASVAADSGNLTISVELPGARRAATAANAMSADLLDFAANDALLDAVKVADALPSSSPSGPPRRLLEIAALLVGALAGAAVALLLERGRPRIRTWRDVGIVSGYTVVGRVPSTKAMRESPADALVDPAVGASMRTLRTNLERASREQPTRVLAVTSSLPGEGKTTIAASLAVTLARLESRVLLLDADL
ncbi:MAG: tyrosine-protein kinase, partial [Actinomycetota bacterium]